MSRWKPFITVAVISAMAAVIVAAFSTVDFSGDAPAISLSPDDAAIIALGEKIYGAHCAACHGSKLEGQPNWRERRQDGMLPAPPHDASGHTWHHADEVLFRITKYGIAKVARMPDYPSAMPVYEGLLTDLEIVAALSWIKSRWPPETRQRHDEINVRYRDAQRDR